MRHQKKEDESPDPHTEDENKLCSVRKSIYFQFVSIIIKIIVQYLKNNKYRAPKTSAINPKGLMEFNFNKIQCLI